MDSKRLEQFVTDAGVLARMGKEHLRLSNECSKQLKQIKQLQDQLAAARKLCDERQEKINALTTQVNELLDAQRELKKQIPVIEKQIPVIKKPKFSVGQFKKSIPLVQS